MKKQSSLDHKIYWGFLFLMTAALSLVYYEGELCSKMWWILAYDVLLLILSAVCIHYGKGSVRKEVRYLIGFFFLFIVPSFSAGPLFEQVTESEKSAMGMGKHLLELAVFALLMLPYLQIAVSFGKGLYQQEKVSEASPQKTVLPLFLPLLLLPGILFSSHYGIWVSIMVFCYGCIIVYGTSFAGESWQITMKEMLQNIRAKGPVSVLLLIYPVLFLPFRSSYISDFSRELTEWLWGLF